jgi:cbb3-type cytochrome oxidase maturation protein
MEWFFYTLAFLIAVAITGTAVFALHWSSRHGQLRDFERGATSIFDDEEPVGQMTDRFPQAGRRKPGTGKPETGSGEAKPESLG